MSRRYAGQGRPIIRARAVLILAGWVLAVFLAVFLLGYATAG